MGQSIEALDALITANKRYIEDGNALQRLKQNADFQRLFLDFYINEQSVNLVKNKAALHLQEPAEQKYLDAQLLSVGLFYQFMQEVEQVAKQATDSIQAAEEEKEMLIHEMSTR